MCSVRALSALVLLLVGSDALAGKKRDPDPIPAPPLPAQPPAAPAGGQGISIGRPAGMDFTDVPCPYLTTGAKFSWNRTNERTGRQSRSTRGVVTLSVVDGTPESALLDVVAKLEPTGDPVLDQISAGVADAPVQVRFTRGDRSMTVENLDSVVKLYRDVTLGVAAAMVEQGKLDPVLAGKLPDLVADPAQVSAATLADVAPLLLYTCGSFSNKASSYLKEAPNPFGGAPLPMKGQVGITKQDLTKGKVTLTEQLDRAAAVEILRPDLLRLGLSIPEDAAAAAEGLPFALSSSIEVELALATGVVTRATTTNSVSSGEEATVETTVLTLIP